jgi:hypothetical protein
MEFAGTAMAKVAQTTKAAVARAASSRCCQLVKSNGRAEGDRIRMGAVPLSIPRCRSIQLPHKFHASRQPTTHARAKRRFSAD